MPKLPFLLVVIVTLLGACKNTVQPSGDYFDSLITVQVKTLSESRAGLTKIAGLSSKRDSMSFTPTRAQWAKELDVFRQLGSFENPAYTSSYVVNDKINDPTSNLLIRTYHSDRNVPVPDLRFYYFRTFQNIKRVEATYRERNVLFSSSRKLVIEFSDHTGQPVVSHYSLKGTQKITGSDSVGYFISASIEH